MKKYAGKPIVIMTPLHRSEQVRYSYVMKREITLKEYVDIIREVAQNYSLPVLDLYASSGIQPQIEEHQQMYMPDGLHPNDEGNKVIAHKLQKFLENL